MATRGHLPRNPHLQVGSRLILLVAALALVAPSAMAESASPTPSASSIASASASPTATAKATASATAKATATKKPTPTPTKKKVVAKKSKARVTPSPKPVWPPKGFSKEGEVYAKVPTAKELVGLISANKSLETRIKQCTTYICGSVVVASLNGCLWWEAVASVTNAQGVKLGELSTAFTSSKAKEFKTLILITPESLENGGAATIKSVICNHVDRDKTLPGTTYTKTAAID